MRALATATEAGGLAARAMQACCPELTAAASGVATPFDAQVVGTLVAVVNASGASATVLLGGSASSGDGSGAEYETVRACV